ncbi:MAG: universal stress protein [Gemmatimonas sp.]|uniref:universal stress protein n=1 Tax=Gemmatimonas sp. TaxID=1962908 RepID=UPI00391983A0
MRATETASPFTAPMELLGPLSPVQPPHGPVLIASDASDASDATFPVARLLAVHTGASIEVMSAVQPTSVPMYAFDAMPTLGLTTAELVAHRTTQVRGQLARLVPDMAERAVRPVTVRSGEPVGEIVQRARELDARVIVVGRGRHGMLERTMGGESVLRLLQRGETPVLAVDPGLERLPRRVVIATDFSAFSVYAAQVALPLCAPDATVELVHVAPNLTEHAPGLGDFANEYRTQVQASFRAIIDRLAQREMTFETTLLEGNVSTRLMEHLERHPADLIVTATHGYGFLRRVMLGSVAAVLVRSAPCSVLCVPGTAHTHAAARAQTPVPSDQTRAIPLDTLDAQLAAFTERHRGHACTVEVQRRDIGTHALGHHLVLAGMSYEAAGRILTMSFGPSEEPGNHLSHQVPGCEQVVVVSDASGRERRLVVKQGGGVTELQLET